MESLENGVGEGGFEVDKDRCYCGDVFHPSLAMVTCVDEESKRSEMVDVHQLAVVEEQGV
jgi:hypothetical protein